jgi:hypothetical protein
MIGRVDIVAIGGVKGQTVDRFTNIQHVSLIVNCQNLRMEHINKAEAKGRM